MRDLTRRPALRALAGTVAGNLPGLLLPFLITARVEAGRLTDAYFFAFAIALFGTAIVSLTLENNVVPVAAHHKRRGAERLREFVRRLLLRSTGWTLLGYAVIGALAAGSVLVRGNWSAGEKALCIELIAIFGVFMAATSATAVLSGALYAFGNFFVTTLTIGVRGVLPVPPLFLAADPETALLLSAAALAFGECVRGVLLAALLRHRLRGLATPAPEAEVAGEPPSVWSTALPYGLAMVLLASTPLVDRVVAGSLDPGAITTLDLAEKIFYTPIKILMASVLLVAGARWAAMTIDRPQDVAADFRRTVRRAAILSTALASAIAAVTLVLLVTTDTTVAGVDSVEFCVVLAILMAGFPAAVVTNAGVRLLTSLRRTRMFPALAAVAFSASVGGSIAGAALLGTPGIALAGTVWRTINLVLFLAYAGAALRELGGPPARASSPSPTVVPAGAP